MMPTTLVLVGPHGVGKTTTGRLLAEALALPFHDELGRRLAEDLAIRPSNLTAADAQPDFDRAVITGELARDARHRHQARVVETWHPGNLAYATLRSGPPDGWLLRAVEGSCLRTHAVVVPLVAGPRTLAARKNEPGDAAFFQAVGRASLAWARQLALPFLDPVSTEGRSPEQVVADILRQLPPLQEVA